MYISISVLVKLEHHIGLPFLVLINVTDKMVNLVGKSSILRYKAIVLKLELVEKTEKLVVKRSGFNTSIARLGVNEFVKMSSSWIALVSGKSNNFVKFTSEISTGVNSGLEGSLFSKKIFSVLNIDRSDVC